MNTLKNFNENTKGMSVIYKTKSFMWALKYAWQRAWRGYDDTEVFGLNDSFIQRMLPIMKDFRRNNMGLFCDGYNVLTMKQTNEIIDEMIDLLEHSDENAWMKKFSIEDMDKDEVKKEIQQMEYQAHDNQHKFLNLFVKQFDQLWY